jgi:D-aminoacyl-tRNA deacylase
VGRVSRASVTVDAEVVGALDAPGLLVLLGVHRDDPGRAGTTDDPVPTMARKLHELRLLRGERSDGESDRGELSCAETGAGLLVVSQFTLYGDTRRGRRPSWSAAAPAAAAERLVAAVVEALRGRGATVATGVFGARMAVESVNDGPFTVLVEV